MSIVIAGVNDLVLTTGVVFLQLNGWQACHWHRVDRWPNRDGVSPMNVLVIVAV